MRSLILITLFCIFSNLSYADVIVNEIMYDPLQNENYNEWLELYNNGSDDKDISNMTLCEENILQGYVNKSGYIFLNVSTIIKAGSYALITDGGSGTEVYDNFNVSNDSVAFHVNANSLCGGLSNTGKVITLFFEDKNTSVNYTNSASEGYSLELINGSFIQSKDASGTPGKLNTAIITQNSDDSSNSTDSSGELGINIILSNINLTIGEIINISGNITTTFSSSKNASLTIKIARNISNTWSYKWYALESENITITNNATLSSLLSKNSTWIVPDDMIVGNYKILATLEYNDNGSSKHRYSNQYFYINGLEDLGEYNMTIVESPESMGFGEISKVTVKFVSNNYNLKNASFVAYIYDTRWASIDFNDNTLMTRPYNTNVAMKFKSISRATTNYVSIPILTKRNCEDDYNSGSYKVKVRIYENDEYILEDVFNLQISSDKNEDMCPKAEIKYVSKSSSSTSKSTASTNIDSEKTDSKIQKFSYDKVNFEINIPKVVKEKEFEINISAENNEEEDKRFEIWSYVYYNNKLITKRYDNKKEIFVEANKTKSIKMIDILPETFENGNYEVFVKINSSNRKTEKTISEEVMVFDDSKKEQPHLITGFYTKSKKFSNEIILVSGCINQKNFTNYNLTLYYFEGYDTKNCNKTVEFRTRLNDGNNMFFLILEKDNDSYEIRKMMININGTSMQMFNETKMIYDNLGNVNIINDIYGKNLITGSVIENNGVIYESSNEKVKKLIKYILPTLFLLGIGLYLKRD